MELCRDKSGIADVKNKKRAVNEESSSIFKEPVFPNDIIIDILSRLPAKDVLGFLCTCKNARALITTRDFTELHMIRRSSFPMILVKTIGGGREQLSLENCWESERSSWESERSRSMFHESVNRYPEYCMQLSHDGLIVSKNFKRGGNDFIIFNPIYPENENVTVTVPGKYSDICGVFYQSRIQEYCTLWEITVSRTPRRVQYQMLNLGSEPYWKEIRNPWTQNGRIPVICPVLVDYKYLYWIVEPEPNFAYQNDQAATINVDIMEFDTTSERFEMISCPVPVIFCRGKCNISLLNVNGLLVLFQICLGEINIWTFKDRAKKLWEKSSYINTGASFDPRYRVMSKAIGFWNGELVYSKGFSLFVCNLNQETTREFGKYQFSASIASHVICFASLKNCKSKIHMESFDLLEAP